MNAHVNGPSAGAPAGGTAARGRISPGIPPPDQPRRARLATASSQIATVNTRPVTTSRIE